MLQQQGVTARSDLAFPAADPVTTFPPRGFIGASLTDPVELRRVNVADKRVINGSTDVNQLVPFKYKWAWEKYLSACANHWMPQEIQMSRDIELWKNTSGLTEDERSVVKRKLGFLVNYYLQTANDFVTGTLRPIT